MFYKVTPAAGKVEIGAITSGFLVHREQRSAGRDGTGLKMIMTKDAGITADALRYNAEAEVTINGETRRYSVTEFLPQQQLGAGYVLRLMPLQGATG